MSVKECILTGDLHLRKNLWKNRHDLVGDTYFALGQIVQLCKQRHADVIIAGDVFDSPRPSAEDVLVLQEAGEVLAGEGLDLYLIQGNHDQSSPSWADTCGLVLPIHKHAFTILGEVRVYGLDYCPPSELQASLLTVPKDIDLLVCHQLLDLFFPKQGNNMEASWVPDHLKMVLVGDFHETLIKEDRRGIKFISPGSTSMQKINEVPAKSVFSLSCPNHKLNLERVPILSRKHFEYQLRVEEDLGRVLDDIRIYVRGDERLLLPENLRRPLVKICYCPDIPNVLDKLKRELEQEVHLWATPTQVLAEARGTQAHTLVVTDILSELVNPEDNPRLYDFISELLTVSDPRVTLDKWKKTCGLT